MGDYAAKELKFKRVATISDDFAFGHEQMSAFQRVFEDAGGKVVKKLWPPLVTPDYTPFIAQIGNVDGVFNGFAGSNPVKFMRAYADLGLKGKIPLLAGWTGHGRCAAQEPRRRGRRRHVRRLLLGRVRLRATSASWRRWQKDYGVLPGGYSAGMYVAGQCVEAAIQELGDKADDRKALAEALHKVSLADTPRGAVKFDQYGNVIGEVFIRRCEQQGRPAGQHGDQDLSQRQPVLDLRREGVPGEPGLHARLSAGEEPGELRLVMLAAS